MLCHVMFTFSGTIMIRNNPLEQTAMPQPTSDCLKRPLANERKYGWKYNVATTPAVMPKQKR